MNISDANSTFYQVSQVLDIQATNEWIETVDCLKWSEEHWKTHNHPALSDDPTIPAKLSFDGRS
jgi:hypothetical protein